MAAGLEFPPGCRSLCHRLCDQPWFGPRAARPARAFNRGICHPLTGLYRWVSCPNYLGEVVLWIGWAVATRSMAGLAFAVWTIANLAPRAWAHHRWYRQQFEDYPPERKAMLPGIW